ncbi:putative E3 ubiquitin-protein ligase SINA-like 9 [Triticum dicoccoides]|uniref:putative E3 ubiquitin-protein ligase SINA-like 9 n=1 Tax=Triticum dicoccoides TaxID=85692 RepID=UPI0018909895|nr:putative E3 ubiquitin-protein ligase SINA-like 9 [Triticum dicoccoides]
MAALPLKGPATVVDVTVDADALNCGVCCLPLKSPIFQCKVGHVICSPCRDNLAAEGRCHVCQDPISGGYQRSYDMEKLVESIRVPCSNAAYGCSARPTYSQQHEHVRSCQHLPCHCPADTCGFVGSTSVLLDHFAVVHRWPCTTELRTWKCVDVQLRDDFNAAYVRVGGMQYLFLLNVARQPFGRSISVFCVHPRAPVEESSPTPVGFEVRLKYSRNDYGHGDMCRGHSQETKFKVACTDLSDGLPNSEGSFEIVLPKCVHPLDMDTITAIFDVLNVTTSG